MKQKGYRGRVVQHGYGGRMVQKGYGGRMVQKGYGGRVEQQEYGDGKGGTALVWGAGGHGLGGVGVCR